jgi:hypothetical protein
LTWNMGVYAQLYRGGCRLYRLKPLSGRGMAGYTGL